VSRKLSKSTHTGTATVTAQGNTWTIDYKWWQEKSELRVYRVYGDVTKEEDLKEALEAFAYTELRASKIELEKNYAGN
jgi:hypothetical protein